MGLNSRDHDLVARARFAGCGKMVRDGLVLQAGKAHLRENMRCVARSVAHWCNGGADAFGILLRDGHRNPQLTRGLDQSGSIRDHRLSMAHGRDETLLNIDDKQMRVRGAEYHASDSACATEAMAKANSSAVSFSESKRPDAPPCPESMLVFSRTGPPPVMVARNRATHFAGSQ